MALNLDLPTKEDFKPRITVFGVGGAGGNAVNNMIESSLQGATFVVANTDAQALENSLAPYKIQLGEQLTKGLGAGASPEVGGAAAEESIAEISEHLEDCNMVFITAGMGGGTGTGAAPVIAKAARDAGILTVGVVTKPFNFEGAHRSRIAEIGLQELQSNVDTLIVIPNQNLFRIASEKTTFADAFSLADNVLHAGVRGVTDLIVMPGLINLDFADIRAVMSEMGKAMMGTGEAQGDSRAIEASEAAISNPLLDNVSMKGAKGVLINITGGPDMTLFEVDEAANRIREEVDPDANIIFGSTFNNEMEGALRVSVIATGIEQEHTQNTNQKRVSPLVRKEVLTPKKNYAETARKEPAIFEEEQEPLQENQAFLKPAATNDAQSYIKRHFNQESTENNQQNFKEAINEAHASQDSFDYNNITTEQPTPTKERSTNQDSSAADFTPVKTDYDEHQNFEEDYYPEKKSSKTFGLFGLMGSRMGFNKGIANHERKNEAANPNKPYIRGNAHESVKKEPTIESSYNGNQQNPKPSTTSNKATTEQNNQDMYNIPTFVRKKQEEPTD